MWEIFIDLSLNISQRKRYFLQWSESPRNCAKKVFHGLLNAGESSFCTVMLQGVLLLRRILAHCSQSHGMAPGFPCSMLLPPLKSWVLRGTVRIKLLAWEGKCSNPALARTQVSHSRVQRAINTWPPRLTTAKQFIIHRGLKGCKLLKKILIKKCQFFSHNGSQLMVNAPVQYSAWICLFNIKTTVTWLNLLSNMLEVAKIQKWKLNILLQRLSLFQWISGINWYRWVDAYINILLLSRRTGNSVGRSCDAGSANGNVSVAHWNRILELGVLKFVSSWGLKLFPHPTIVGQSIVQPKVLKEINFWV